MKLSCYFTVSLLTYALSYEYKTATGLSIQDAISNPEVLYAQLGLVIKFLTPSFYALQLTCGYFAWLYVLTFIVPGYYYQGPPLRDGRKVRFYINGLPILFFTAAMFGWLGYAGYLKYSVCYDEFGGLLTLFLGISVAVSSYLFVRGRAKGLSNGSLWDDFVMGQELVPEVLGLKLNFFWLRPSMMAWLFLNLSFLAKHYEVNGQVSHSMLLYQLFTNWYVMDYFLFEEFVTSTWDIIAEKFGFMLVWGDLVFIPFTFTLQAWYLVHDKTNYDPLEFAGLVMLFLTGYLIFRLSNKQKHDFKKNPKGLVWGKKPEILGGRLLVSGWWGVASHINYLGDLILAVSYAAPCGIFRTGSFIPWFYPTYLFLLLIHREWRDDLKCSQKYGKLWQEYRQRVPYRIFPYIY